LASLVGFMRQSSRQRRTGVAPVSKFPMLLKRKMFSQRQAGSLSYN